MAWTEALGTIGGSIISSAAGIWNASKTNKSSKHAQERQQGWEEYMSNTAVGRRMLDLQEAGINPMLAGDLTATTPAGNIYSAQQADLSGLNQNYAQLLANLKQTKETTKATENAGQKSKAEAEQTKKMTPILQQQAESATAKNVAEKRLANAEATTKEIENEWIKNHPTLYTLQRTAQIIGSAAQLINSGANVNKSIREYPTPKTTHFNYNYYK